MGTLTNILAVLIGLFLMYGILSLVSSVICEIYATQGKRLRSHVLRKGIAQLLHDNARRDIAGDFFTHPLVTGLPSFETMERAGAGGDKTFASSYLTPAFFCDVIMDLVDGNQTVDSPSPDFLERVKTCRYNEHFREELRAVIAHKTKEDGTPADARASIGEWFTEATDRLTSVYKRRTTKYLAVIGAVLVLLTNADTIHFVNGIWSNPQLNQVKNAEEFLNSAAQPLLGWSVRRLPESKQQASTAGKISATVTADIGGFSSSENGLSSSSKKAVTITPGKETVIAFPGRLTAPGSSVAKVAAQGSGAFSVSISTASRGLSISVVPGGKDTAKKTRQYMPAFLLNVGILNPMDGFMKLVGLALTVLAILQGAPFWFDLVNKFANIRQSGDVKAGESG